MSGISPLVISAEEEGRQYFRDLFRFHELFFFIVWRDILVRYKQTFFGIFWSLIRPLLNMAAFAFVFGKFAKLPSQDIPYPLFVLAGLLPWQWFSGSLQDANMCLVVQSSLLTKTYFPRIYLPLSLVILNGIDFCIGLALFTPFVLYYGMSIATLFFPVFLFQCFLLCSALSLFFSSVTVYFRDFKIIVPFFLQIGLFLSPVGYSSSLIPHPWGWLYACNPLVGIIDGFRWTLLGTTSPLFAWNILLSWCMILVLLTFSLSSFRKWERGFADVI